MSFWQTPFTSPWMSYDVTRTGKGLRQCSFHKSIQVWITVHSSFQIWLGELYENKTNKTKEKKTEEYRKRWGGGEEVFLYGKAGLKYRTVQPKGCLGPAFSMTRLRKKSESRSTAHFYSEFRVGPDLLQRPWRWQNHCTTGVPKTQ